LFDLDNWLPLSEYYVVVRPVAAGGLELLGVEDPAMSNLIVPDDSKRFLLSVLIGAQAVSKIKLFKNNFTPAHDTIQSNLTEADFGGYVEQAMSTPVVSGSLDASFRGFVTWDEVTFTRSSAPDNTIYGYWVNDSGGNMLWVERFDNPIPVTADGIFIKLTPKLTDKSQFLNT
jgi:hypothetical protein